jgi:hypothetical protein
VKITQSHLLFWQEKRAPTPTWAAGVAKKMRPVDVNHLINVQVERYPGAGPAPSSEPGNTLAILRMSRRHFPSLVPLLCRMAADPQVAGEDNQRRRAAFCRRLLRRMGVLLPAHFYARLGKPGLTG